LSDVSGAGYTPRVRAHNPRELDPDEAAEYALHRWGYPHYLATRDIYRGTPSNPTWREFAIWIRQTREPGAEQIAQIIGDRPGRIQDFALPVEPLHVPDLHWQRVTHYQGLAQPGDWISAEIAPGTHYMLLDRGPFEVWIDEQGTKMYIASEPSLDEAKLEASMDYLKWREHSPAHQRQQNPGGRWDLQTVIVEKSVAPTRAKATEIARGYANRIYTSRETAKSWRFRQRPPKDFVPRSFRTRKIPRAGVSLVYGQLARAPNNANEGWTTNIVHLDTFGSPPQHKYAIGAMQGNELLGFLEFSVFEDTAHVDWVNVYEKHRRKGVARSLYHALYQWAQDEGLGVQHGMTTELGEAMLRGLRPELQAYTGAR
jgi:GNAT superfamily N-acetyltransferase